MIGKRIGIVASLIGFVASVMATSDQVDDHIDEIIENKEEEVPLVNAGIVVSVTEDFLKRGQNELIHEFVSKMNRVSDETHYEINLSDYLPDQ